MKCAICETELTEGGIFIITPEGIRVDFCNAFCFLIYNERSNDETKGQH